MTRGPFLLVIAVALVAVTALVGSLVVSGGDAQAQSSVPAAPTGLSASAVSHDAVTLAWDDPADAAITGYQVLRRSRDADAYRDGRGAWEFVAVVADTASSATSYTDTSVTARTRYVYRVKAINPAGLGARSSYLNVETSDAPAAQTAPAAPTGLSASSVTHDAVSLAWDDPGDTTIGGYEVLRRSRDGDTYRDGRGAWEFVAVVADTASPATSYTDTTVTARTRYVYRVKAINPAGLGPRSSYLNVETPDAPTAPAAQTAPAAPTGLNASSVSHDSVSLAWDDAGDTTISGYEVLRRSRDGDTYRDGRGAWEFVAVVADTASSATSYTDTTVTAHTRYVYRVVAVNAAGSSPRSSYLNVETPDAPALPAPTLTVVELPEEPPEPVATEVLVTEPPADEPQTAQQQTDDQTLTTTIWTTTMTVGHRSEGTDELPVDLYGYDSGAYGSLDDDTFDYNGHTYTVRALRTEREGDLFGRVQRTLSFVAGERDNPVLGADLPIGGELVLYVGDQSYRLEDTTGIATTPGGFRGYIWRGLAELPVLVDGEAVEVRLVEELPPIPAPETIWSTTMTAGRVERILSGDQTHGAGERETGYTILGDPSGHLGSLDGDTFDYGGDTYTVHQIRRASAVWTNRGQSFFREVLFHVTVDDHGDDLSDLALYLGGHSPHPFADAASSVTNFGLDRVRTFVFSELILWFNDGQRVAVRIDRLDREFRGPDGHPLTARLAVGDEWADQTYPTSCRSAHGYCTRDVESQWFLVRLESNRRYIIEIETEADNLQPRLRHIAPSWNTDRRLSFTDQFDNTVPWTDGLGNTGIHHTGGTDMLYLDTNADSLRGGDYYIRLDPGSIGVADPDYRIRIREQ